MKTTHLPNISAIDLFCGVGGLTYGLKRAGINVVAGIDFDETCKYSYEANNDADFISSDICKLSSEFLLEKYWNNSHDLKLLVGCAPCQPFSSHSHKVKNKTLNPKWNLLNEFKRLINETKPEIVSMENVPNLAHKDIFYQFLSFLKQDYNVSYKVVYCPKYGIPQRRKRLVLLASKLGDISLIQATHEKNQFVTVKDTIGKVNDGKENKDKLHRYSTLGKLNLERIKSSRPGGNWLDWPEEIRLECHKKESGSSYKSVYGRMKWDDVAPTITTQFYNYGTGRFGHPEKNRALSIREGAMLQTFPENYKFASDPDNLAIKVLGRHIGNAVPPRLGEIIGNSIIEHIKCR